MDVCHRKMLLLPMHVNSANAFTLIRNCLNQPMSVTEVGNYQLGSASSNPGRPAICGAFQYYHDPAILSEGQAGEYGIGKQGY